MADDFKPNIYPIMYWGLMYGLVAGFVLFILFMLSRYLTLVWFPVFMAGVVWGGYRNYKKQKQESGQAGEAKPAIEEFKEAARDIVGATKEMVNEQLQEAAERDAAEEEVAVASREEQVESGSDTIAEESVQLPPEEITEEEIKEPLAQTEASASPLTQPEEVQLSEKKGDEKTDKEKLG